eukprot:TRINITY_DN7462_c1_g1_i1.p1 TRINITY_DN7462_c1_g1~~TRINITY_DN7462_c1_g1_i1.p1  ORF type:complete len:870 (+),score=168.60 TRINITY_DN7462_c1_g1_i1:107-2716(+)
MQVATAEGPNRSRFQPVRASSVNRNARNQQRNRRSSSSLPPGASSGSRVVLSNTTEVGESVGARGGLRRKREVKPAASSNWKPRRDAQYRFKTASGSLMEVLSTEKASRDEQRRGSDWADIMEETWQAYTQEDEFQTFHAVVELLLTLPPTSQIAERRDDFELLVHLLHRLGTYLNVEHVSKNYRAHYSPDVQLSGYLYSTLLTAFTLLPTYVLNGQEFYVSDTVLDQCQSLQNVFAETCEELKRQYENLQPYSLEQIRNDVRRSLTYFDKSWCRFEMPALEEIEAIHRQACRPLIEAIEVERGLCEVEGRTGATRVSTVIGANRVRLDAQQSRLMEKINELNRLANIDGRGRSDMDLTCVIEAERIVAKPMCTRTPWISAAAMPDTAPGFVLGAKGCLVPLLQHQHQQRQQQQQSQQRCCGGACASPVLLRISRTLLRHFERLRRVLRKYSRCLYQLNSHLANNVDLVKALELFENAWETGNRYLVQTGPRKLALVAYDVITSIREPDFQSNLASLDPGFLVATLPRALLLHEMLRAAHPDSGGQGCNAGMAAAAVKSALKAPEPQLANAKPLPLPTLCGNIRGPLSVSALKRSPLAKAFLPTDAAASFDEVVAVLGRCSETRVLRLRKHLLAPMDSSACTPTARCATGGTAPLRTPLQTGNGRPPGTGRCSTGRCSTGKQAERPPATPCPPRMAVPTTSGGCAPVRSPMRASPSGISGKDPPLKEESDLEDEDDDECFYLDLASLREVEADHLEALQAAATVPVPAALAEASPSEVTTPAAAAAATGGAAATSAVAAVGEDEERQVIATISMLALRLQREKAQEWNELIQVVIQGLLPARGSTPTGHGKHITATGGSPMTEEPSGVS